MTILKPFQTAFFQKYYLALKIYASESTDLIRFSASSI